jgi:hypothetical protein
MQSKPVLAANDGFSLLDTLSNEGIGEEIQRILGKLENFGMVFCKTEQLAAVFKKVVPGRRKPAKSVYQEDSNPQRPTATRLITAKDIRTAVDNKQHSIPLAPGGIVTPLAKDMAGEYAIRIDNQGE